MTYLGFFSLYQQKDSSLEESESSGDEKQEVTSNFKEESEVTSDLYQFSQKPSRHVTISKRYVKKIMRAFQVNHILHFLFSKNIKCFLLRIHSTLHCFSRDCPTSTSTEEEAIQGMLSMAGLHYTTCLPGHTQSPDCTDRKSPLQEHRSYPKSRHKDKMSSHSHKAESGRSYLADVYCI